MTATGTQPTDGIETAEAEFATVVAGGLQDPYPHFHRIRESAPLFKSAIGLWVCSSYEACRTVLRDDRYGKDWPGFIESSGHPDWRDHPSLAFGEISLIFSNPPHHSRLRGLVSKAFTPRQVERLRENMKVRIADVLDGIERDGGGDFLDLLAFPLPVGVIGDLLGVPEADWGRFRSGVRAVTRTLEIGVTPEEIEAADKESVWMHDYFSELIAEKRANPDDAMISAMIAVSESGDHLSDVEIIGLSTTLFAAGFETTTNLIGNGLHALVSHPDQLEVLRNDPGLAPKAAEECLRFDASIQISTRTAFEDADLTGQPIAKGETVLTLLGAANRDPAKFDDPDRFDITRETIEPLSFGSGIHYCLGASLARVEAAEAFAAVAERFPTLEFAVPAEFRPDMGFRGLTKLELSCSTDA